MAVTTEQLIALAQEAADLTNVVDYVTPSTWASWLNAGALELHRFVTNKFKATYYRTYDFTLTAGKSQIALPSNFWRLKGLDLDADTPRRRTVLPFNFASRNQYQGDYLRDFGPTVFCPDRFYNVLGSSLLKIQPQEKAAGAYRLYYTPKPKALALVRSFVVSNTDSVQLNVGPNGETLWHLGNAGFVSLTSPGDIITIGLAVNGENDGAKTISSVVTEPDSAYADGAAVDESFDGTQTATYTTCLDAELEPFSEYVWLTAAIKSLVKEESFAQAKMLADQRNLIREDLTEALETDQGGPSTIIDTDKWDD